MNIYMICHAQPRANTGAVIPHREGDHRVTLTPEGITQVRGLAAVMLRDMLKSSLLYCSPFPRMQETLQAKWCDRYRAAEQLRVAIRNEYMVSE